jgi:hypothetical protein
MKRALGRMIGAGLLGLGLVWVALLVGPDAIKKKTLPKLADLSADTRLAPGSVIAVIGFLLFRACRPMPKPLGGESESGGD